MHEFCYWCHNTIQWLVPQSLNNSSSQGTRTLSMFAVTVIELPDTHIYTCIKYSYTIWDTYVWKVMSKFHIWKMFPSKFHRFTVSWICNGFVCEVVSALNGSVSYMTSRRYYIHINMRYVCMKLNALHV